MSIGGAEAAQIELYLGQGGSGKGVSIRHRLAAIAPRRLVIWDPQNEYGAMAQRVSLRDLTGALLRAQPTLAPLALRYVPDGRLPLPEAFGLVCRAVYHAGSLCFLAEELSDVTRASWAPPAWRVICTQGRHRKLHVLGAAQRAALIDKTAIGNSTLLRVGSLAELADRRAMAQALDVAQADVDALRVRRDDSGATMLMLERRDRGEVCQLVQMHITPPPTSKITETRRPVPTLRLRKPFDNPNLVGFDTAHATPAAVAGQPIRQRKRSNAK